MDLYLKYFLVRYFKEREPLVTVICVFFFPSLCRRTSDKDQPEMLPATKTAKADVKQETQSTSSKRNAASELQNRDDMEEDEAAPSLIPLNMVN